MAIEYRYDREFDCVQALLLDKAGMIDFTTFFRALKQDRRVSANSLCLCDTRQLEVPPSAADIRSLAVEFQQLHLAHPPRRSAIIASSDVNFGLSRMFVTWLGESQERVFKHVEAALEWLGLPNDSTDPFSWEDWRADYLCHGERCLRVAYGGANFRSYTGIDVYNT